MTEGYYKARKRYTCRNCSATIRKGQIYYSRYRDRKQNFCTHRCVLEAQKGKGSIEQL